MDPFRVRRRRERGTSLRQSAWAREKEGRPGGGGVLTSVGRHATKGAHPRAAMTLTRDDLEQLDTRSLRALARQHLPDQARALRTRPALLAALARTLKPALPDVPARASGRTQRPQAGSTVGRPPTSVASAAHPAAPPPPFPETAPANGPPIEEGFFLVRARERPRARVRRSLQSLPPEPAVVSVTAAAARLPPGDEVPHLLARDATTVFLFWDFRRDLERGAAFGLAEPRVRFRLYDGESVVRTVEAPLGRRSVYLEGLQPGHVYSVEAFFAGSDGHARPTGRRSAPLRLAPAAPSANLEVELLRVPWEEPLAARQPAAGSAGPSASRRVEPVGERTRVDLPASLEWRGGPGVVPGGIPGGGPGGPRSGRP